MQFSFIFFSHFILSFAGFLCLGIYLCRGTWRNVLRQPLALGLALIAAGHVAGSHGMIGTASYSVLVLLFAGLFIKGFRAEDFVPSEVRGGHNAFSLLAGAALFGLTVQLHGVLFGVPVFQLVK
jgi:hypothetical protein